MQKNIIAGEILGRYIGMHAVFSVIAYKNEKSTKFTDLKCLIQRRNAL